MEQPKTFNNKINIIFTKKKLSLMYLPGLSALNLKITYPLFGTAIVSLAGGKLKCLWSNPLRSKSKACFKLIFFTFWSGDLPIPTTLNTYPCKWKGWLKFGDWTEKKNGMRKGKKMYILASILIKKLSVLIYLRPLKQLQLQHWVECRFDEYTCNFYHNLLVCYHHCKIARVAIRPIAITVVLVVMRKIFHRLNWLRGLHQEQLKHQTRIKNFSEQIFAT